MRRRQGFTLVELLVVIGIIALLISILLPSLNRAKQSALKILCAAQMRQLGNAFQLYINDYRVSPALYINKHGDILESSQKRYYLFGLWKYCGYKDSQLSYPLNDFQHIPYQSSTGDDQGDKTIFHCPVTYNALHLIPGAGLAPSNSYGFNEAPNLLCSTLKESDGMSQHVTSTLAPGGYHTPLKINRVRDAAKTCCLIESQAYAAGPWAWRATGLMPHMKGLNVLFYDWHVENRQYEEIPKPPSDGSTGWYPTAAVDAKMDLFWSGQGISNPTN